MRWVFLGMIVFLLGSAPIVSEKNDYHELMRAKQKTQHMIQNWHNQLPQQKLQMLAKQKGLSPFSPVTEGSGIGTTGDILVTLDGTSSPSFAWAGGHAGIVAHDPGYVIESFGNKGDLNGVRYWKNDWKTRYQKVKGLWIEDAKSENYQQAAQYSVN